MITISRLFSLSLLAIVLASNTTHAQTRIYVDTDAAGINDGTSWENAYTSLSGALAATGTGDTVWVAEGTYLPEHDRDWVLAPNSVLATFSLPDSIVLLGGFAGDETSESQRDWNTHPVILSGDVGTAGQNGDNAYHVVFNADTAWMDGFIIEKGYCTVRNADWDKGAGIYNSSRLTISNCILRENYSRYGAAAYCDNGSHLEMDRCLIYDNETFYDGWGGSGETGGIELQHIDYASINNTTIWANNGVGNWGINGIFCFGSTQALVNSCIIWENAVTNCLLSYSCFKDATGTGNIEADPMFTDPGNGDFSLQRGSPCINSGDVAGDPDPDGTRMDMGAVPYYHDTVDLGIMAFNHWDGGFETGLQDVTLTLKSFGTENITSAEIGWKVDGAVQTPFSWSGDLGLYEEKDSIAIGSYDFTRDYHILEAWIISSNGETEKEYTANDTLIETRFACTGPLFDTIPLGALRSYKTFTDAANALCNCGISESVTFLVDAGVYNEQVLLKEIPGTGPNDTVLFASEQADPAYVILSWAPTADKPYTLRLDSTEYLSFREITIETRDSVFGHAIELGTAARSINLLGNRIIGDTLSDALVYSNIESSSDSSLFDIRIKNNYFRFGKAAIRLTAQGYPRMEGICIDSNHMEEFLHTAIDLKYALAPKIRCNLINSHDMGSTGVGIVNFFYVTGKAVISGNQVLKTGVDGSPYGMRIANSGSSPGDEMLVLNNFISLNSCSYNFAAFQTAGIKIYNNSMLSYGNGTTALYLADDEFIVYNNNLVNLSGGPAVNYAYTPVPVADYNNYFTTSGYLIQNGSNKPETVGDWFTISGQDEHSVNSISGFFDLADLHTLSRDLDSAGTPLPEVLTDIDGQPRNATHPDIGADEYAHPGVLSGEFIVGKSDTADFGTVIGAFNLMYMLHVENGVDLLLEPGQHKEQLVLHAVPGATLDDPVTLTSLSGDSSDTWIAYDLQSLGKNYVYQLRGARHLHFSHLGFRSDSSLKYQGIIELVDSCVDISFTGCNFLSSVSTFQIYGDLLASRDIRNTDISISGCNFLHGRNQILVEDTEDWSGYHNHISIHKNIFTNYSGDAIALYRAEEPAVFNNRFNMEADYTPSGGYGRGLYMQNCIKGDTYRPMAWNNVFNTQSASGMSNPITLLSSDSVLLIHNTVYSSSAPLSSMNSSGTIQNNIFYSLDYGKDVVSVDDTAEMKMLYNAYFYEGLEHEWEMAFPQMDSTSVQADPLFLNTESLVPGSPFLNKTALYSPYAHYDRNGLSRFGEADIGAVQFDAVYNLPFKDTSACYWSTIELDAGPGFDSYLWSNDSTGQTFTLKPELFAVGEKDFHVTSTFRGNDYTDTISVMLILAEVDLGDDISVCADDTVYLDAGPGFVEYDWHGGSQDGNRVFKTTVDIYSDNDWPVRVVDAYGCEARDTVTVHYKRLPAYIYITQLTGGSRAYMEATHGDDVKEYQWYKSGVPIQGEIQKTFTAEEDGWYSVEGMTNEGCTLMSDSVQVLGTWSGDIKAGGNSLFSLAPNPAKTTVSLKFNSNLEDAILTLLDLNGRVILQMKTGMHYKGEELELDLSGTSPGCYYIQVQSRHRLENEILILK